MDALKKTLVLSVIAAMLLCVVPVAVSEESDAAGDMDGLMLYAIAPYTPEGVAVHNYGSNTVNLADYLITDQPQASGGSEGRIAFSETINVKPGETVVIMDQASDGLFASLGTNYIIGQNGITSPGFTLSNSGDDVYLMTSSGTIIDAFCYGNKTASTGWERGSVTITNSGFAIRYSDVDTDSSADWCVQAEGHSNILFDPNLYYTGTVTPFLFPDDGGIPIYQALESATESVYITMYQLTNVNVYALLCDLESRGVDVTLLLEGESLSSNDTNVLVSVAEEIHSLIDAGGEVRLIGVGDDGVTDRYTYVHAKYAIIDMDTVIVTSENWTAKNLNGKIDDDPYHGDNGNRGWGAVIESEEYAQFMKGVFDFDYSMEYGDVKEFTDLYGNYSSAGTLEYTPPQSVEFESYEDVLLTPVLSCDNSYAAMRYYINNAQERIYTEQQSLGATYTDLSDSSPVTFISDKANQGVECIAIFDDTAKGNKEQVNVINSQTNISAALMTGTTLHNKGLICDDYVWVSSINWTTTSFNQNREVAVVFNSKVIADYYAESILSDFEQYYSYDGMKVVVNDLSDTYESGKEGTFGVSVLPEGDFEYTWDFGDGTSPVTTTVPRVTHTPQLSGESATYTLTVTVRDVSGEMDPVTVTGEYTVVKSDSILDTIMENIYYLLPIIVVILGIIAAALRSAGKKKRKSTKKKR